jgi:hypothetical protein
MPHLLQRSTAPVDYDKVTIETLDDMRYWCSTLGCSEYELKVAVREAGPELNEVKAWLKKYRL